MGGGVQYIKFQVLNIIKDWNKTILVIKTATIAQKIQWF